MLGIKLEDPTPSNTFAGVHFILLGFDPVSEQKIGSKLVNGGGVDVGHYGPLCTHVIGDKVFYDDPMCVAARRDGKILVTGLWVDHSFDVGMAVDPTSVMYRPLKGRDGIPGAKTLLVCLTGYQRQDRDDIMTMVSLMGANFSKPLVANKVTHLICYKFEGEKYELARKMKRIKLVNHRWLEDCLKSWEILPEADYDKSGYELEMMETEAKDSEEEDAAQEHGTKQNEETKIDASPNPMTAKARVTPQSEENLSSTPQTSNASKGFSNVCNGDVTELANRAESVSAKKLYIQDIDINIVRRQDPLDLQGVTNDRSYAKSPTSARVRSSNMASDSDGANSISKSSLKKTDCRNTLPVFKKEIKSLSSFSKVDIDTFKASDGFDKSLKVDDFAGFDNSLLREEQSSVGTETGPGAFPSKEQTKSLCGKRKMDISYGISKSPKINCDSKACNSGTPSASNSGVNKNASLNFRHTSSSPRYTSPVNLAKENEYNFDPQSLSKSASKVEEPRPSSNESVNMGSAIEHSMDNIMGNAENASTEAVNPQRQQNKAQVPSPKANILGLDKSSSPSSDTLNGKDGNSLEKPARKKTIAKRTWNSGSRPKVALREAKNQKDSIYINDAVTAPKAGKNDCEKAHKLPSIVNVDEAIITEMSNVEPLEKEHMDDETEAPEDKEEDEVQGVFGAKKADETKKLNMTIKDRSECTVPSTAKADDNSEGTPYADERQANFEVPCGKNAVDELAIDKDCELEKPAKSLGKRKSGPSISGKRKTKEEVGREEFENKRYNQKMGINMEKQSPSPRAKAEGTPSLEKAENLTVVEKESRPVVNGKSAPLISGEIKSKEGGSREKPENKKNNQKVGMNKKKSGPIPTAKIKRTPPLKGTMGFIEVEKENRPVEIGNPNVGQRIAQAAYNFKKTPAKIGSKVRVTDQGSILRTLNVKSEPTLFLLTGHKFQRKEFQQVIKRLRGRVCRDSHKWSYEATHFINPDPLRRTEKFFAAAASGRWILKTDYLTACNQAGKFLAEEPYEWHKKCLSEDGAINLEAPRKWRLLRERTGHGAFYGMRVIIYGECIAPSLETLKRVIKAGDGTIVATSPPYTRFLNSGVDFAIVSSGMPHVDMWVQEFLRNEIPCIVADYLVEYICKPGYLLDKHVLYNTQSWAEKSFAKLQNQSEEVVLENATPEDDASDDIPCEICGSSEREEVMLICGDESGSFGCGVGTHINCCNPPLENVPDEDWFCSKCVAVESKKNKGQSKSTKRGRPRSKAK